MWVVGRIPSYRWQHAWWIRDRTLSIESEYTGPVAWRRVSITRLNLLGHYSSKYINSGRVSCDNMLRGFGISVARLNLRQRPWVSRGGDGAAGRQEEGAGKSVRRKEATE